MLFGLLVVLGFGGAFLSGLVGVGGAIVMIPLLLYVPPLAGLEDLGIKAIAGITIVQIVLTVVFALMASAAAIMMLAFRKRTVPETDGPVSFKVPGAVAAWPAVGSSAGLIGAGGAFCQQPIP